MTDVLPIPHGCRMARKKKKPQGMRALHGLTTFKRGKEGGKENAVLAPSKPPLTWFSFSRAGSGSRCGCQLVQILVGVIFGCLLGLLAAFTPFLCLLALLLTLFCSSSFHFCAPSLNFVSHVTPGHFGFLLLGCRGGSGVCCSVGAGSWPSASLSSLPTSWTRGGGHSNWPACLVPCPLVWLSLVLLKNVGWLSKNPGHTKKCGSHDSQHGAFPWTRGGHNGHQVTWAQ